MLSSIMPTNAYDFTMAYCRWLIFHWFASVDVAGAGNIPEKGVLIFLTNHPSLFLDPGLICSMTPKSRMKVLASILVWRQPVARWMAEAMECIPIFRKKDAPQSEEELKANLNAKNAPKYSPTPGKLDLVALKAVVETLVNNSNVSILIFPEGTTHLEPELKPFKTGTARVMQEALEKGSRPITIVPTYLNYSNVNTFRTTVTLGFGKPTTYDLVDVRGRDPRALSDEFRDQVRRAKHPAPPARFHPRLWLELAFWSFITWYTSGGFPNHSLKVGWVLLLTAWVVCYSLAFLRAHILQGEPAVFVTVFLLAWGPAFLLTFPLAALIQGPAWTLYVYLPFTMAGVRALRAREVLHLLPFKRD